MVLTCSYIYDHLDFPCEWFMPFNICVLEYNHYDFLTWCVLNLTVMVFLFFLREYEGPNTSFTCAKQVFYHWAKSSVLITATLFNPFSTCFFTCI